MTRGLSLRMVFSLLFQDTLLVVLDTSQTKPRTRPQREARHPPCCIRRHALPRSKGRSKPRTAFPLLTLRRHRFPGSKGRSSAPTQIASHHESWCWWCRCCCCCCCRCRCCYCCCCCCCYCHASASCCCSSGPPVETLYRDQRGGWTPSSRRRFC